MNAPLHKCLFHPSNSIVKFCENKQCTLPLCHECEPIHLQEHHSQQSEAKVLRFNEATLKASNNMEDYIDAFATFEKEMENKIENDRQIVNKMVDEYYSTARKMIKEIKENVGKVTQNLNKLNKGSIKALIFYYSGDIKMNKFDLQFEPLQFKIRNMFQNREETAENQHKGHNNLYQAAIISLEHEYKPRIQHSEDLTERPRTKERRNAENDCNIFSGIQEIKEQRNHSRNRKSIFDNSKKNSGVTQTNNNSNPLSYKQPEIRTYAPLPQYEHQPYQVRQMRTASIEQIPKFQYGANYQYKNYEKTAQQPEILSFENRFLNKYSQQFDQPDQNTVLTSKEASRPDIQYEQLYSKKVLKAEDLEIEKQNSNFGGRTAQTSSTLTQRNRSMSQNNMNMNERDIRKENYDYDLKRQVLSPEEIRKMLQKKIEERNRVLSIKKADNYPLPEEKGRKGWETRDSIINQIYSEPKY